MLLHTHMVLSVILGLTAAGMFVHLYRLKEHVKAGKWLRLFYLGLLLWQIENVVRYSVPLNYYNSLAYRLQTVFVLMPTIAISIVCHTQYAYRFLVNTYRRERDFIFKLSIIISILENLFVAYNVFVLRSSMATTLISMFFYSTLFTIWLIILSIRKARRLAKTHPRFSNAHYIYAAINSCYLLAAIFSLIFGFFSVPGFWAYFSFVWLGNLASIVLYIVTSAVPASFQTKITGFTFVLAASFLTIITLTLYPPIQLTDITGRIEQHEGLKRMVFITITVVLMIFILMPFMLRFSLTNRLKLLLQGVQKVNEGDLSTTVEVGLKDEIGLLSENFNNMTHNLKIARQDLTDYAQTLEKKVLLRTEQLQTSLNELKALQSQLIQAEKLASLGELTAGIAHEIKNPLNFINNFSEVSRDLVNELITELERPEPEKENITSIASYLTYNLESIYNHGKKADSIVEGMLEHSRPSKGESQETDINELTHDQMKECYQNLLDKKRITTARLETHFDRLLSQKDQQRLLLFKQDIGRALSNIFTNAYYSVTDKKNRLGNGYEPLVIATTKLLADKVLIQIRDNGLGIKPTILDKIFEPFFTTKPTEQSTGLGLSLSYDIIKSHGGELLVDSIEGEYAEFTIELPTRQPIILVS